MNLRTNFLIPKIKISYISVLDYEIADLLSIKFHFRHISIETKSKEIINVVKVLRLSDLLC